MGVSAILDLEKAGQWYARGLELTDAMDSLNRGKGFVSLGMVAFERFKEARADQKPNATLLKHINTALQHYQTALEMIPVYAMDDLGGTHNQLGNVYSSVGDVDSGVKHWRNSVIYHENAGNYFEAGVVKCNIAVAFARSNRIPDALDYARAALRNFEMYGDRAADMVEETKGLIQKLSEPG